MEPIGLWIGAERFDGVGTVERREAREPIYHDYEAQITQDWRRATIRVERTTTARIRVEGDEVKRFAETFIGDVPEARVVTPSGAGFIGFLVSTLIGVDTFGRPTAEATIESREYDVVDGASLAHR